MSVSTQQKNQVRLWVQETLKVLGWADYPNPLKIEWKNAFTSRMGDANGVEMRVRFSIPLWSRATEEQRNETVVHEVCHIVAYLENEDNPSARKIKPHGREWRDLMNKCGLEANRTHNVDTKGLKPSSNKQIKITCSCSKVYLLTPYMVGQVAAGNRSCGVCNTRLIAPSGCLPTRRRTRRTRRC